MTAILPEDKAQLCEQFMQECLKLNKDAMFCLNQNATQECYQLLRQAQTILKQWSNIEVEMPFNHIKIQTLTLNNLGCYYKKVKKPYAALKQLNNALYLEKFSFQEFPHSETKELEAALAEHAGTFLNICVICTSLGKHHEAIQKALMGISCIKRSIRLLNPNAEQCMSEEDQNEMLQFVNMFGQSSSYNNFTKDELNIPESYRSKKLKEETLLKFTGDFITTHPSSVTI